MKVLTHLDWTAPDPETSGAGLHRGTYFEAYAIRSLFPQKPVQEEALASPIGPCHAYYSYL